MSDTNKENIESQESTESGPSVVIWHVIYGKNKYHTRKRQLAPDRMSTHRSKQGAIFFANGMKQLGYKNVKIQKAI